MWTPKNNTRKERLDRHLAEMSVKSFFKTAFRLGYYLKIMYAMPRMCNSIFSLMSAMRLVRMERNSPNIFCGCKDIGEIIECLNQQYCSDEGFIHHSQLGPQDGPHQVMFCVNTMIRFLLEGPYSIPMESINEIGSQAFNYACTLLFGEGFEDTTDSDNKEMQMNDVEGIIRMLRENGMPRDAILSAMSALQRRDETQANGRRPRDVPFFGDMRYTDGDMSYTDGNMRYTGEDIEEHDPYDEWPF